MNGRRDFLRGLATLPLIGGSVASAEPITPDLLEAYKTWLEYERRFLAWEMADMPAVRARYQPIFPEGDGIKPIRGPSADRMAYFQAIRGIRHHVGMSGEYHRSPLDHGAASRAALVLSTVGCDWHDRHA